MSLVKIQMFAMSIVAQTLLVGKRLFITSHNVPSFKSISFFLNVFFSFLSLIRLTNKLIQNETIFGVESLRRLSYWWTQFLRENAVSQY